MGEEHSAPCAGRDMSCGGSGWYGEYCEACGRRATYQHPPRPVERERARSVGDACGGVLRALASAASVSCVCAGASAAGADAGDALWCARCSPPWRGASASGRSMSGRLGSGEEGWLLLPAEEGAGWGSRAIVQVLGARARL